MEVRTGQYEASHGKAPRGYGMWAFEIAGETKFATGSYTEAKRKAMKWAALAAPKVREIEVLP